MKSLNSNILIDIMYYFIHLSPGYIQHNCVLRHGKNKRLFSASVTFTSTRFWILVSKFKIFNVFCLYSLCRVCIEYYTVKSFSFIEQWSSISRILMRKRLRRTSKKNENKFQCLLRKTEGWRKSIYCSPYCSNVSKAASLGFLFSKFIQG